MASSSHEIGEDSLRTINDALRAQASEDSPWLPLESNPVLFTQFAHSVGLSPGWGWHDVLGLDEQLLEMVPQPCCALILLFPCSEAIFAARRAEELLLRQRNEPVPSAFFLKQHAEFGNACGSIASIHALSNSDWAYEEMCNAARQRSTLGSFVEQEKESSPSERGRALLRAPGLKFASDSAASGDAAQTALPRRDGPDLDHHFAAFVVGKPRETDAGAQYRLLELDGTKACPVDHGPIDFSSSGGVVNEESGSSIERTRDPSMDQARTLLARHPRAVLCAAARVIRKRFMEVDPENIEFSVMALCKNPTA